MKKLHIGHLLGGLCLLALGLTAGMIAKDALASRNAAGTMSGINGPYVSGTTISSSVVNARLADIETEITDSLDRSGKGGMLAALRGTDGTLAAPAFSWTSETGSGLFRNGASDIRMSVAGGLRENWTSTGVAITGTASVTGASTLTGSVGVGAAPTYPLDVNATVGNTIARFNGNGATTIPLNVMSFATATDIGSNIIYNGGYKYVTTGAGTLIDTDNVNARVVFYTAPSGTAGNAATITSRAAIDTAGLTIGATGTAISASNRGTVSWTPGTVTANTCAQNTVTVTGATAGTECAVGSPGIPPLNMTWACAITLNTCTITICNATAVNATGPAGTWSCRAFNP